MAITKGLFSVLVILTLVLGAGRVWAAPSAPAGTLVFSDDFSDPKKSGLEDNVNATDYSRGFHAPGVYHLKLSKNDDTRMSLIPNQSYGEFSVEMDLWDNSDSFTGDVSQGIVFRTTDATHMYAVLLDPRNGKYAARKLDGASWSDLIAWKASSLVKSKSDVNHLRIDGTGGKFTLYLNGESLDSFSDPSYTKGGLGLIASNIDAPTPHMHFDNLKVYSTENTFGQGGGNQPSSDLPVSGHTDNTLLITMLSLAILLLGSGASLRKRLNTPLR